MGREGKGGKQRGREGGRRGVGKAMKGGEERGREGGRREEGGESKEAERQGETENRSLIRQHSSSLLPPNAFLR